MTAQLSGLEAHFEAAQSEGEFGQLDTINDAILPALNAVLVEVAVLRDHARLELAEVETHAQETARFANISSLVSNGSVTLFGLLLAFLFGRYLATPIERARTAIAALTNQDYDHEIPDQDRRDEVGMIARSVEDLRTQLSKAGQDQAQAKRENAQRIELFQALTHAMTQLQNGALDSRIDAGEWHDLGESYVKLCNDFNGLAETLQQLVASLRSSTQTVQANATELSGMSDEMSRRSEVQAGHAGGIRRGSG